MTKKFHVIYLVLAIWFVIIVFFNIKTILNIQTRNVSLIEQEIIYEPKINTTAVTSSEPVAVEEIEIIEPTNIVKTGTTKLNVPFTTQAPFAEWDDERQQNACEEAAAVMAMAWVQNRSLSKLEARDEIVKISDWEMENYGVYHDTSAEDTVERIFRGYFKYEDVIIVNDINSQNIIDELEKGNLVIVPVNGQELGNPYFTAPGPLEHMIVIIGYDYDDEEFIVNESGTRHGKNYRYDRGVLFNAIRDYPTGYREPVENIDKVMIVVSK